MNKTFTKEALTGWVKGLMQAAKEDEQFSVSWFIPTKESRFSIVGGWVDGYPLGQEDLFCMSKSKPTCAMCIEVVDNESLLSIVDEVECPSIILEWKDDPAKVAEFFMIEWEQLMDAV